MLSTCGSIVEQVLEIGVEEEDKLTVWMTDADEMERKGSIETAKAIYQYMISIYPNQQEVWR